MGSQNGNTVIAFENLRSECYFVVKVRTSIAPSIRCIYGPHSPRCDSLRQGPDCTGATVQHYDFSQRPRVRLLAASRIWVHSTAETRDSRCTFWPNVSKHIPLSRVYRPGARGESGYARATTCQEFDLKRNTRCGVRAKHYSGAK